MISVCCLDTSTFDTVCLNAFTIQMPPVFNVNKITLPHFSSKTKKAIESGDIVLELPRARFVRECVAYYEPILPRPTGEQYTAIAKVLLKEYPCLRDKGTIYWVSIASNLHASSST